MADKDPKDFPPEGEDVEGHGPYPAPWPRGTEPKEEGEEADVEGHGPFPAPFPKPEEE